MSILHKFFKHKPEKRDDIPSIANLIAQARSFCESGQLDQAQEQCQNAFKLQPGNIEILTLAFQLALRRRTFAEIKTWLRVGIDRFPDSAEIHFMLGFLHNEESQFNDALVLLQKATQLDPDMAKAHNSLGAALQMLGRLEEALQSFQRALMLDPELWRASYNIANMHKLHGRFEDAVEPFQRAMKIRRGADAVNSGVDIEDFRATRSKLTHDMEQYSYLVEHGILGERGEHAIAALGRISELMGSDVERQLVEIPPSIKPMVAPYFNRLTNFYSAPALPSGALNQDQDWAAIERAYFGNAPGMTFVDNFLKPEALASLRRFCLESTIWFDFLYGGGYVGCSCEDGFICPLLAQIAEEQRLALPSIFGPHRIKGLWGYKYDSQQTGISTHADFAAINVNFWITPDEANLDPGSGGLVIWDKEAPLDWNFDDYNSNVSLIAEFLRSSGAKQYVIPYKQNRVALFNSDLFHKTDNYRFKNSYESRRINVTMLYGDRHSA